MLRSVISFACLTVAVVLAPLQAAVAEVNTLRSTSFGDSLTDNEPLYLLFGTDPAIYGADPFEAMFDKAAYADDTLTNYAVVGSTSFDVLSQVRNYAQLRRSGQVAPATLVSLQGGGNDFLDTQNLLAFASAAPGESPAVDRLAHDIEANLLKCLLLLERLDHPQFVLWTIPDVTLTPYVLSFGFTAHQQQNIRAHVAEVNSFIQLLDYAPGIAVMDIAGTLTAVTFAPPIVDGVQLQPTPAFGFPSAIFADPIHPTAVANAILTNDMIYAINEEFDDDIEIYSDTELGNLATITP
ncbi:hypothetical protein C5Y93_11230 [Blastopirellula marina]|uniref:Uncharacterized protein n=1 Tax=Blastopirellula marina TaxID=124 RepID=A0A2S8GP94_9BACT|nr:hypothetical protein C5Y93_11230 [Blastopirellula marina]